SPPRPVAVRVSVAVVGAAPHTLGTPPPPQVCGAVQTPQVSVPPQPSGIVPQFFPCAAHVVGVHAAPPQTFATPPPPHGWGAVQAPHLGVPPQPFAMLPQFLPCAAQLVGMQVVAPPSTILIDSKVPVFLLSAIAAMTFPSPETAMASVTNQLAAPGTPAST